MQKILVNAKPEGFGLSREAAAALGLEVDEVLSFMQPYRVIGENALRRDHDRLVDVVETLGQGAIFRATQPGRTPAAAEDDADGTPAVPR